MPSPEPGTYSGPKSFELHLTAVNGVPVRDRSDCACTSPDFELGFQPETGYPPTVYTVHRIEDATPYAVELTGASE